MIIWISINKIKFNSSRYTSNKSWSSGNYKFLKKENKTNLEFGAKPENIEVLKPLERTELLIYFF